LEAFVMDKPKGRCLGMDSNIFFPRPWLGEKSDEARAVCRQCWVQEECLRYAVETGQMQGIFAGMNLRERRAAAKARGWRT
jgi:WhiB family redox-sensing transcriptional regulator